MDEIVEALGEHIHRAWMTERARQGWRYGRGRNDEQRLHPCMIAYKWLSEGEKEVDRAIARTALKFFDQRGWLQLDCIPRGGR